jgi:ornithine cyclodeaminase/alanine dehydrogenase-like protein (mu-crystallin family)
MSAVEPILLINRSQVRELLNWPDMLAATRDALVAATGATVATVASQLVVQGASLHLKAGALADPALMSVKANLRPDAGNASGAILAFDLTRQRLHAVIASGDLTAMRTAAIAAVAARALRGSSPTTVALLGAGPVAQRVDEALSFLGVAGEVRVWSRHVSRAADLAAGASAVAHQVCNTVEEALEGAELVVTCTPSREALFEADHLHPQAVVLAMGADSPGKRELPAQLLARAEIYADVPPDALRVGESAYLDANDVGRVRELGIMLASGRPPALGTWQHVVFDSVGSSAVDAAVVSLVVARAAEQGVGDRFELDA